MQEAWTLPYLKVVVVIVTNNFISIQNIKFCMKCIFSSLIFLELLHLMSWKEQSNVFKYQKAFYCMDISNIASRGMGV